MRILFFTALIALGLTACDEAALTEPNPSEPNNPPSETTFAQAMLQATNELRRSGSGCGSPVDTLTWDEQLATAAEAHAQDMFDNQFFEHGGSDNSTVGQRVTEAGYNWMAVAENIAQGYTSIEAVMQGWEQSASHCENLMSSDYTQMGAARVGNYWVQVFAKPF